MGGNGLVGEGDLRITNSRVSLESLTQERFLSARVVPLSITTSHDTGSSCFGWEMQGAKSQKGRRRRRREKGGIAERRRQPNCECTAPERHRDSLWKMSTFLRASGRMRNAGEYNQQANANIATMIHCGALF